MKGNGHGPVEDRYPGICMDGLRKTKEKLLFSHPVFDAETSWVQVICITASANLFDAWNGNSVL